MKKKEGGFCQCTFALEYFQPHPDDMWTRTRTKTGVSTQSKVDRGNSVTVSAALKTFIANFAVQDANFVKLAKL